jgi:hypothetical protein
VHFPSPDYSFFFVFRLDRKGLGLARAPLAELQEEIFLIFGSDRLACGA